MLLLTGVIGSGVGTKFGVGARTGVGVGTGTGTGTETVFGDEVEAVVACVPSIAGEDDFCGEYKEEGTQPFMYSEEEKVILLWDCSMVVSDKSAACCEFSIQVKEEDTTDGFDRFPVGFKKRFEEEISGREGVGEAGDAGETIKRLKFWFKFWSWRWIWIWLEVMFESWESFWIGGLNCGIWIWLKRYDSFGEGVGGWVAGCWCLVLSFDIIWEEEYDNDDEEEDDEDDDEEGDGEDDDEEEGDDDDGINGGAWILLFEDESILF